MPTTLIATHSQDFVMCLANYLDRYSINDYERAIYAAKLPIVLDNGAFETGHPDGIDSLLIKARRLNPRYIFAPDTLFDAKKTRQGYENFKYVMQKLNLNYRIGVVVQADNEADYLAEFLRYNADPQVAVIGLSYLAISHSIKYATKKHIPKGVIARKKASWDPFTSPDFTEDRIKMLEKINTLKLTQIKPCHLLGLGKSYADIIFAKKNCPYCLYNDTSTIFMSSLRGIELSDNLEIAGGKIKEKINIHSPISKELIKLIELNIKKVSIKI